MGNPQNDRYDHGVWWPGRERRAQRHARERAQLQGQARAAARFAFESMWTSWEAAVSGATSSILTPITRAEALQVPAVLRARNIIAGTIGTLPLVTRDAALRPDARPFVAQPDPAMVRSVMLAMTVEDLLFEGQAWWRVVGFGWDGYPARAYRVDPQQVGVPGASGGYGTPPAAPDGYVWIGGALWPAGTVLVDGQPVPDGELIRFDSPNPPLLVHAARAIRTALRLEKTADLYASSPRPLGYFTAADGADPDEGDVQAALDAWETARNEHADGYVGSALKYNQAQWSPEQLQLHQARQHAVLEVARCTGIDPEDLGVSTTSRTYQNAVDRRQDRVNDVLGPYLTTIAERLSMPDVTPRGVTVAFDLDDLLKANPLDRWSTYRTANEIGAMNVDEIRAEEGRPAMTTRPAPAPAARPAAPPAPAEPPVQAEPTMAALPALRFSREVVAFELGEADAQFAVDGEARTISGLVVPWGQVARSGGRRYRFRDGSLRYAEMGRVKLLIDHDSSSAVGRMVETRTTPAGQWAKYKVARTPEGDRALALAADGVMDGFSVGVDFDPPPVMAEDGVYDVETADWRETSLTALPAYDDARVDSVRASATTTERIGMHCSICGQDHAPGVACPTTTTPQATPTATSPADLAPTGTQFGPAPTGQAPARPAAPDTAALASVVEQAFTAALQRLTLPQREVVPAAPRQGGATVREPLVYRPGTTTGHSFVRDAWNARLRGADADEAYARLRKYEVQSAALAEAEYQRVAFALGDNDGSTVAHGEIIPPGYRPDMYVGQIPQGRPLVEAMSRGTILNATPFTIPVWVGSSGLTGTNTELTGPSGGTISDHDKRTVTPLAKSGKFVISRELVDSSNPAIDAIAGAALRESYAQETENIVADAIEAATDNDTGSGQSTEGCYVTTAAGSGLDLAAATRGQLAKFPFRRFRAPDRMACAEGGFTALAEATDTTGRPLFPFVGNASASYGGAAQAAQGLDFDGLTARPAWALDSTKNDVHLFPSSDAWVWESTLLQFRFDEVQGPHNIVLALWGYFAFQIIRYTGFTSINFTAE